MAGDMEPGGVQSFINGIEFSARRLKSNIDAIIEKYNHPFSDDDEINLSTLSIHKDRGSINRMKSVYKFGTSQLKSTKRKDELLKRQFGHLKVPINPNVSMAIVRDYDSHLHGSNGGDDEPSDAETISSVSSGDEDTDESYSSEDVNEVDEVVSEGDEVVSEGDDKVVSEGDDKVVSEKDEVNAFEKNETVAENKSRCINENEKLFTRVRETQRTCHDSSFNASICSTQKNKSFLSSFSESCHETSMTDSISSTLRNMSFVSIQSPRQNMSDRSMKKHANTPSCEKVSSGSHTVRKEQSSNKTALEKPVSYNTRSSKIPVSNYFLRSNASNISPCNSHFASIYQSPPKTYFKPGKSGSTFQPEKVKVTASNFSLLSNSGSRLHKQKPDLNASILNICQSNYDQTSSFFTLRSPTQKSVYEPELSRSPKKNKDQPNPRNCTEQQVLNKKYDLPMPRRSSRKLYKDLQNNYESFSDEMNSSKTSVKVHESSLQAKSLQESEPVQESIFKSPQSITVRRIVPTTMKDGRSINFSNPQNVIASLELPKKNTSFPTEENFKLKPGRLKSTSASCSNDVSVNSQTVNLEASFSSLEEDLPQACSTLLESTDAQSPQKQTRISDARVTKLSATRSPRNVLINTSLTSSLKNLFIHPHTSRLHASPQASLTNHSNSVSQKQHTMESQLPQKQHTMESQLPQKQHTTESRLQQKSRESACGCNNCLVKSGLFIENPVQTNLTPQENSQTQNCKFYCNNNSSGYHNGHMSMPSHGFDPKKWAPPTGEIKSPNQHILSPVHGRLKRKISGSFTSGYFTDASASPQHLQNGFNTSVEENTLAMSTTVVTDHHSKDCHFVHQMLPSHTSCLNMNFRSALQNGQSGTTFCCKNDCTNQNCAKTISRSTDLREINLAGVQDGNKGRKFAVAKKKIKYTELCPHKGNRGPDFQLALDNKCRMCSAHTPMQDTDNCKQHQQLLSQTKDSRVCEWVDASSKNTDSASAVHYASCPPKVLQTCFIRHQNCSFHNYHQIYGCCSHHLGVVPVSESKCDHCSHHLGAVSVSESKCDHCSHHLGSVSESKCDHCSHHLRGMPHTKPQSSSFCQFSVPDMPNQTPSMQQSIPFVAGNARTLHCGTCSCHSTHKGCESHNSNNNSTNTCIAYCKNQNSGTGFQLHKDEALDGRNCQHGSLDTRTQAAPREIQSEGPERISTRSSEKHVPDSLSSSCRSGYSSIAGSLLNKTTKDIAATHKNSKNSQIHVPRISLFLKSTQNKSPNTTSRSFVEAHSPGLTFEAPKKNLYGSTSNIVSGDHIMFPDSYIEKFSPRNPARIDSDVSEIEYMTDKRLPRLNLEDNFSKSKPKRQCRNSSARYNIYDFETYSKISQIPYLSSNNKPSKEKNTIAHSSNSMNKTFTGIFKSPTSRNSAGQFFQAASPNSCYIKSESSKSSIVNTFQSREATKCLTGNRASTPVRTHPKLSAHVLEETISTIGVPENTFINGEFNDDSRDSSVTELGQTLAQDSDFCSFVDLL